MATRREIRDAVYNEIVSSATGDYTVTFDDGSTETMTISSDDVDLINPENWEKFPAIFYQPQTTRQIRFNGVGNGPDKVVSDDTGVTQYTQWNEYREDMFILYTRAPTPAHREPVYDAVHDAFGKYDNGPVSEQNFHLDAGEIRVETSDPSNSPDLEDAIWGDQLEVYVRYHRAYVIESGGSMTMDEAVDAVENIAQVNLEVDSDLQDDTGGFTYTIQ